MGILTTQALYSNGNAFPNAYRRVQMRRSISILKDKQKDRPQFPFNIYLGSELAWDIA